MNLEQSSLSGTITSLCDFLVRPITGDADVAS